MEMSFDNVYSLYEKRAIELPAGAATYVLVPGGGHGAWCFDAVKKLLEEAGQNVFAVSLPGVGERTSELSPDIGLADHIAAVVEAIEGNDLKDVILVGHSYGGSVITGAADRIPARIRTIVYLDAVHPSDGQNLLEAQPLMQYVPCVAQPQEVDGVMVNLVPGEETLKFLGLSDPKDIALGEAHLTPHPWKTFTDHLELSDPDIVEKVGKVDIYTTTTINGLLMAKFASEEEAKQSMIIESGHDLMITQPELTANMLLAIAAEG